MRHSPSLRWSHFVVLLAILLPCSSASAEAVDPPFVYRAENKRDPFQPPLVWMARFSPDKTISADESEVDESKTVKRDKEFLETFQLDSIKLVAILFKVEGQNPAAMVEDPEGKGHVIHRGNYLGVHEGRVIQINDGEVVIEEPLPGRYGPKGTRTMTLRLHKEEGQGQGNGQTGKP